MNEDFDAYVRFTLDEVNQINRIINFANTRYTLFKKEENAKISMEDFIRGCVFTYVKEFDHTFDLSGLEELGKPYKLKNNIGDILEHKGVKPSELSEITGIAPSNISYILNNRNQPSLEYFFRIWIALGRPLFTEMFYREVQ